MPDFTKTELWALCSTAEGRYKKEVRVEHTDIAHFAIFKVGGRLSLPVYY